MITDTRLAQAAEMVARAAVRGEPTPTAQQVLDHVVAPLYYNVVLALPVDLDHAGRLVRDVLLMVE